ncbi:hypothetical protein TNCT_509911, partial [Trichonephila clavata]
VVSCHVEGMFGNSRGDNNYLDHELNGRDETMGKDIVGLCFITSWPWEIHSLTSLLFPFKQSVGLLQVSLHTTPDQGHIGLFYNVPGHGRFIY